MRQRLGQPDLHTLPQAPAHWACIRCEPRTKALVSDAQGGVRKLYLAASPFCFLGCIRGQSCASYVPVHNTSTVALMLPSHGFFRNAWQGTWLGRRGGLLLRRSRSP